MLTSRSQSVAQNDVGGSGRKTRCRGFSLGGGGRSVGAAGSLAAPWDRAQLPIAIFFALGAVSCAFGTRIFSTPSLNSADTPSSEASAGRRKVRWKRPYWRSEKK